MFFEEIFFSWRGRGLFCGATDPVVVRREGRQSSAVFSVRGLCRQKALSRESVISLCEGEHFSRARSVKRCADSAPFWPSRPKKGLCGIGGPQKGLFEPFLGGCEPLLRVQSGPKGGNPVIWGFSTFNRLSCAHTGMPTWALGNF